MFGEATVSLRAWRLWECAVHRQRTFTAHESHVCPVSAWQHCLYWHLTPCRVAEDPFNVEVWCLWGSARSLIGAETLIPSCCWQLRHRSFHKRKQPLFWSSPQLFLELPAVNMKNHLVIPTLRLFPDCNAYLLIHLAFNGPTLSKPVFIPLTCFSRIVMFSQPLDPEKLF